MAKLLSSFILFLALALPNSVLAQEPPPSPAAKKVLRNFEVYCQELEAHGVHTIRGVPVSKLVEKAKQIQIIDLEYLRIPDSKNPDLVRRTAYWEPRLNGVLISREHLNNADANSFNGLFTHEILRALDIEDNDFDTSATLNLYLKLKRIALTHPSITVTVNSTEALRLRIEKPTAIASNGGVSGVGGGGDIRSQQVKEAFVGEVFYFFDRQRISGDELDRALDIVAELKFELSPSVPDGSYVFDPVTKTISVPLEVFSAPSQDLNYDRIIVPISNMIVNEILRTRIK